MLLFQISLTGWGGIFTYQEGLGTDSAAFLTPRSWHLADYLGEGQPPTTLGRSLVHVWWTLVVAVVVDGCHQNPSPKLQKSKFPSRPQSCPVRLEYFKTCPPSDRVGGLHQPSPSSLYCPGPRAQARGQVVLAVFVDIPIPQHMPVKGRAVSSGKAMMDPLMAERIWSC